MKFFAPFILILIAVACSSTPQSTSEESTQVKVDPIEEEYPELASISDEDFQVPNPVTYRAQDDFFNFDKNENKDDGLSRESLTRAEENELEAVEKSADPVSSIISLCYQGEFEKAFALSDSIYAKYKKHPSYWTQIGTCYHLKKEPRKAILYYNKAIDLNPSYAPPLNNLGVLFLNENSDQKALLAFTKAAQTNTFSLTPKFNQAQLYLEYGLVNEAYSIFRSLHELNPKDIDVLAGLAQSLLFKGEISDSLSVFSRIGSEHYGRPDISLNYAVALRMSGNANRAKEIYGNIDRRKLGSLTEYYKQVGDFLGAN